MCQSVQAGSGRDKPLLGGPTAAESTAQTHKHTHRGIWRPSQTIFLTLRSLGWMQLETLIQSSSWGPLLKISFWSTILLGHLSLPTPMYSSFGGGVGVANQAWICWDGKATKLHWKEIGWVTLRSWERKVLIGHVKGCWESSSPWVHIGSALGCICMGALGKSFKLPEFLWKEKMARLADQPRCSADFVPNTDF